MDLIQKIKELIRVKNIRYEDIASNTGYSIGTVKNYLGDKTPVTVEFVYKLSEYLKVPVANFFIEDNSENETTTQSGDGINASNSKNIKQQTVNGAVNIYTSAIKDKEAEIEKLKVKIDGLYDRLADKDSMILQREKTIEDKQRFIDLLIERKDKQLNQHLEEKDKHIELLHQMISMLEKQLEEKK